MGPEPIDGGGMCRVPPPPPSDCNDSNNELYVSDWRETPSDGVPASVPILCLFVPTPCNGVQHDQVARKQTARYLPLIPAGFRFQRILPVVVFVNRRLEVQFLSPAPYFNQLQYSSRPASH